MAGDKFVSMEVFFVVVEAREPDGGGRALRRFVGDGGRGSFIDFVIERFGA